MNASDEQLLALADAFQDAALQAGSWHSALDRLARASGSRSGQLIGVSESGLVPFNLVTDMDPDFHPAFVAAGGNNPSLNPRVGAGIVSPVLKVLSDEDFISRDDYRRNPYYQEFLLPWDIPHICLTRIEQYNGTGVGLAVLRSRRDGPITAAQRAVFSTVAPHVRMAVRSQIALEGQGAQLLSGTLEGLSLAAFICDHRGRVRAMTPAAEQLVKSGDVLELRFGHLAATQRASSKVFVDALDAVTQGVVRPGRPLARSVVLQSSDPAAPLVVEIIRLSPTAHDFMFSPRVLVVARTSAVGRGDRVPLLRTAFGLTAAEADIAVRIAQGATAEKIAQERRAAIGTVRAQIKSVMTKMCVRRQAEIVAKLVSL